MSVLCTAPGFLDTHLFVLLGSPMISIADLFL